VDEFFGLRLDKAAKPEIRAFAEQVWRIWNESVPLRLDYGQWHLPFVDLEDMDLICSDHSDPGVVQDIVAKAIKVSVARCARVSYESHETGKRSTIEADMKLHDFLLESRHLSPFEHQATPDEKVYTSMGQQFSGITITSDMVEDVQAWANPHEHGNFVGWRQRRKQISGEAIAPLPEEYRS